MTDVPHIIFLLDSADLYQDLQIVAEGPHLARHLFVYGLDAKDSFYILNGWGKKSKEEYLWHVKLYEIQILVSINTVLLEDSYARLFTHSLGLFSCFSGRVE